MKNQVKLAILHGSRATGKAHKNSDWDVAVLAEKKLGWDEIAVQREYFAKRLKVPEEKIDIADLKIASPLLQSEAAKKGRLLFGQESQFLKFKIFAWKHYLATLKFHAFREHFLRARFNQ